MLACLTFLHKKSIFGFNKFLTLIIYFWIRVVGTSSRIQNKNEISINLRGKNKIGKVRDNKMNIKKLIVLEKIGKRIGEKYKIP